MIDLVIPLGKGSKWANNELRYCLRSIEKYLTDYGRLFIVGEFPDFLNSEAIHIPQPFVHGNPARNIAMNILEACRDERLSERFAYLNDDYFFTQPIDISTYPVYYKEDLQQTYKKNQTEYRKHVRATIVELERLGLPTINYDTHYPCIFEKGKMKALIETSNFDRSFGLVLKSLYFNTYPPEQAEKRTDCKQHQAMKESGWQQLAAQTEMFSIADTAIDQAFKNFMAAQYPTPSKYEK